MAQKKFIIDGGFSTNAESTITGNLLMTGSIIPSVDSNGVTGYDLGSATAKWRDLYLSKGSLYIDGQKVLQSDSGTIVVSADVDQSLLTKTTGAGVLTFQSPNPISISGTLQMGTGKRITSADGLAVVFGDKIDMDANQIINVANPTTAQGVATKDYVDVQIGNILNGAPDALNTLNELAAALGDDANFSATVTNALALKAATTYVDSQDTATLNAAKAYSDGLAFGTGSDLSATNSRVTTNETEIDALQADMATAQADILTNASGIADNATAITDAISTAAADATSKANAAETAAKAYTDTRETAITTAYTTAIATATAAQDEINELADVNITSVANGQFLRYDLGSTKWVNVTANTTMIAEGTKLYFTDARAQAAVADNISSAVAAEATARANADASLQTQIDFITSNVDAAALDSLTEIVAAFQTADGNLVTTVTANTTAINNEVTARTNADAALQTELNTTQTGAGLAASGAYTAIGVYDADTNATGGYYIGGATSLANADKLLDSALKAEELARANADTTLQTNIDALSDGVTLLDTNLTTVISDLSDEASTRANADTTLQTNINNEASAREASDDTLQSNIDAEATARIAADSAEATARANADVALSDDLTSKIGDGTVDGTEGNTLTDRIATSLSSANSYTDGRETAITTAYQAADTTLQTQINTEKGRIDAILTASTADKDTFAEIVTFINSVDTTNDTALGTEITTRSNADAALQAELDATQAGAGLTAAGAYTAIGVYDADTNATGGYYIGGATSLANADKLLDSALKAEEAARISGDSATLSSAQSYADTAEADAITSANAYTDGRETAITTAYQAYADQAEADAETAAAADATSKVNAEATARIAADTALDNAKVNKTSAQALHATDALRFAANTLSLYKGDGTFETVDLSLYVDDTNLARIVSGTMASNGIATFTRDDETSFTVDMSILLDDTNLSRIVSATWNTGDGVLTLTRNDESTVTVDLDDRYSLTSHNHTLDSLSNVTITSNSAGEILKWNGTAWVNNTLAEAGISATHSHPYLSDTHDMTLTLDGDASGTATFTNMGNATLTVTVADDSHNHVISNVDGLQAELDAKLAASSYTAADVLSKLLTVDGAGSGLDADLLDGQSSAYYLDWTNVTNKPDPVITVTLTGDVTGSGNATLTDLASGTISFATTIAANSVALGTDTTGNYAGAVAAGAGISVTGTAGEGTTFTVAHADTSSVTNVSSNNSNGVVIQDVALTFDTYGHVTAATVATADLDNRYVQPADLVNFHSAPTSITSANATTNASGTLTLTFSELSGAVHYNVYLNRMLLRPTEYSISGTSVIIAQGIVATDDEVEVAGLKLV